MAEARAQLLERHDLIGMIAFDLATALARQNRKAEALPLAQEALSIAEERLGPQHRRARRARELLAQISP